MMLVKDLSFTAPLDNLLFDDALLAMAEAGTLPHGAIRFWESSVPFVVLGRSGVAERECRLENVRLAAVPVLRRRSGGGTVVQGPGCLNYALVLPKVRHRALQDVVSSYRWISQRIVYVLKSAGIHAVFQPISDIALAEGLKKFSGNAQHRSRSFILHHGTLLYRFDCRCIENWLAMPASVPPYRQGRDHRAFVSNIPLEPSAFKRDLAAAFGGGPFENTLQQEERDHLERCRRMHATAAVVMP